MKRPLVAVAVAFATGTYAASRGGCPGAVLPITLGVAGLALAARFRSRFLWRDLGGLVAFAAAGALLWNARHAGPPGDPLCRHNLAHPHAHYALEGRVRSPAIQLHGADGAEFAIDVQRVRFGGQSLALTGRALVWAKNAGPSLRADELVRVAGRLSPKLGCVNPGIYGSEDPMRTRGVHTALRLEGPIQRLGPGRW